MQYKIEIQICYSKIQIVYSLKSEYFEENPYLKNTSLNLKFFYFSLIRRILLETSQVNLFTLHLQYRLAKNFFEKLCFNFNWSFKI